MVRHSNIKSSLASAIADNNGIRSYCVENFGRSPIVIVDWFGPEGTPGVKEAPFIFIYSASENDVGFVDRETFTVHVVVAGRDTGFAPTRKVERARTPEQSGLVVNGIADKLEILREKIEELVASGSFGAVPATMSRIESSTVDFPLEWSKLVIEFFEPETL